MLSGTAAIQMAINRGWGKLEPPEMTTHTELQLIPRATCT